MKQYFYVSPEERKMTAAVRFVCAICEKPIPMIPIRDGFSLHYGKHEYKPEKETPKEGELIEVAPLCVGTKGRVNEKARFAAYATGVRHRSGYIAANRLADKENCGDGYLMQAWRYPGETDWRD